jgi:hypothetical protein
MNQGVADYRAIDDEVTDTEVTGSNVASGDVMGRW